MSSGKPSTRAPRLHDSTTSTDLVRMSGGRPNGVGKTLILSLLVAKVVSETRSMWTASDLPKTSTP